MLPKVPDSVFTEQLGLLAVSAVAVRARCLWRPTPLHDVGIDGQIEYVTDDYATGRIVLVQVKSGASYFDHPVGGGFRYTPEERHRNYWERCPLPVILVLHHPERDLTIWLDARAALRSQQPLIVPLTQRLDTSGVLAALAADGPLPKVAFDPTTVITEMIANRHRTNDLPLDFFDLFFHGLTDLGTGLYFGMDLVMTVAEAMLALADDPLGVGLGREEYDFIDGYVQFLVAYDLARVDFDWFARSAGDLQMVGHFLAPLTQRGLAVVRAVIDMDGDTTSPYGQVVQERFIGMIFEPSAQRMEHIAAFKARLAASSSPPAGTSPGMTQPGAGRDGRVSGA